MVGKCLEKDRELRYQSIRDVALDLRAAAAGISGSFDRPAISIGEERRKFSRALWLIALTAIALWAGLDYVFTAKGVPTYYGMLQVYDAQTANAVHLEVAAEHAPAILRPDRTRARSVVTPRVPPDKIA